MSICRIHAAVLSGMLFVVAPTAAQVSQQTVRGGKTGDLAALCAASPQDPSGPPQLRGAMGSWWRPGSIMPS